MQIICLKYLRKSFKIYLKIVHRLSSVLAMHAFLPGSLLLQFENDGQDQEKLLLPEIKKGFAGHDTGVVEQESHLAKQYLI